MNKNVIKGSRKIKFVDKTYKKGDLYLHPLTLTLEKVDKDKISAYSVHAFTASGAILGFLAIVSILNNDQAGAFLWLGMAILVDGVDGTLARKVGVEDKAPNLDGIILDSISV